MRLIWFGQVIVGIGFSRADNPFDFTLHGSLFAKQKVILTLDPVVCNVSVTSAHSDLQGVNSEYNENMKGSKRMCGARPGSDTPFTLCCYRL